MTVSKQLSEEVVVALIGNPNVGKSTLFNNLTGQRQHTGNWTGKTVDVAEGEYFYKGKRYVLVDLPGTYSMQCRSPEEQITIDYLKTASPDCVLVVADATCLERNLSFLLQVMDHTEHVALCINLMDEAKRKNIKIEADRMRSALGIPIARISADDKEALLDLKEMIRNYADGFLTERSNIENHSANSDLSYYNQRATEIYENAVQDHRRSVLSGLDRWALGKYTGRLVMVSLLLLVFWLTIWGANYPSAMLSYIFEYMQTWLQALLEHAPAWIRGIMIDGIYSTTTNVIAVMLPPMLIFFPLFTLLEDFGYLPRAAFLADHGFEKCGSCGKQALTMAMGFGCNAVGITGCRIISTRRERLLAVVTNCLVPCNGKFPALIILVSVLFGASAFYSAVCLTCMILLSIVLTMFNTWLLSKTVLNGERAPFVLEMPPYRRPRLKKLLTAAVVNRTLRIVGRAVVVAAPMGALVWLLQTISVNGVQLLIRLSQYLEPIGTALGMNGVILLAFMLSFPANEMLIPMILMITNVPSLMSAGLFTKEMALCTAVFALFHWPCSTSCITIAKETRSWKAVAVSVLLPTLIGAFLCLIIRLCVH